MIIRTTLTVFSIFMLILLSIIVCGLLIFHVSSPILAGEIMPYDLISQNDSFKIVLDVNNSGIVSAVTYSYEFAD